MYYQKRGNRLRFLFYDREKKTTSVLKQGDVPVNPTPEEAQKFCRQWEKKIGSATFDLQERLKWKDSHPEYLVYLEYYREARKEDAENSWESNIHDVSAYVFPYFLEEMQLKDFKNWPDKFEDFRSHLTKIKKIRRGEGDSGLAFSTINGIIKSLNTFMEMLHRRRLIDHINKCRSFDKSKMNRKSAESVIPQNRIEQIYRQLRRLKTNSLLFSEFFLFLIHTGMRINEALGVSLPDFDNGKIDNEGIRKCVEQFPYPYFGFVTLDSQPKYGKISNSRSRVARKPLKGKKLICGANSRIHPIFDKQCFKMLVIRWNEQRELFERGKYGKNPSDYLLFNGINRTTFYNAMKKVQIDLGFEKKFSPHDCRHTFSTWMVEKSAGSTSLCRYVLGHSSEETTQRYVHIVDSNHREQRAKVQFQRPMQLLEEKCKTISLFPDKRAG